MSRDELLALPATTSIESAARALGMGRTRAYELAKRGQFPCKVIRIGVSYRVVTADLHRLLGVEKSATTSM
jgi:predicted DNA-binding transcriptional regulator AlpA